MFVGDSLSLNQWQSITCMLHAAVAQAHYTSTRTGGISTFTFPVRLSLPFIHFQFIPLITIKLMVNIFYFVADHEIDV